jgi:hypothetical protein
VKIAYLRGRMGECESRYGKYSFDSILLMMMLTSGGDSRDKVGISGGVNQNVQSLLGLRCL